MSSTLFFMAVTLVTGALVPFQLAFNAQLGASAKSPLTAGFIIFAVGAVAFAAVLAVSRPSMPTVRELTEAPATAWLGGLLAALYILAVVTVIPRTGVGMTAVLIIAGQLLVALVLEHLGAFNAPRNDLTLAKLAGAGLVVSGVGLVRFG